MGLAEQLQARAHAAINAFRATEEELRRKRREQVLGDAEHLATRLSKKLPERTAMAADAGHFSVMLAHSYDAKTDELYRETARILQRDYPDLKFIVSFRGLYVDLVVAWD